MKIAVVIPVKNERQGLERLIRSLISQVSEQDEIIFVDAGSTDGTKEMLEAYKVRSPQINVFYCKDAFPGKGRNIAVRNTDAEIIAQIDGGNLSAENWLRQITAPIKNGTADYVTGNINFMPINRSVFGIDVDLGEVYGITSERRGNRDGGLLPAGGASVAYKRTIWEKAGGFPEWMRYGEDPVFVRKILQQDVRTVFVEKAVVYWQIGPSFLKIMKRIFLYQMATIRTRKDVRQSASRVLIHLIFIISIFLSIIIQNVWILPASIFMLLFIKRMKGSLQIYTDRVHGTLGHNILIFCLFLGLESTGFFFRIAGTIRGLLKVKKNKMDWEIKVNKYLAS